MDQIPVIDVWKSFGSYVNTYQGGWFRPQTDFESALNDIQYEVWERWTKMADKSQEVTDNLRNFLISENVNVKAEKGNYGTFIVPKEYARYSSARIITDGTITIEADLADQECEHTISEQIETEEELKTETEKAYRNMVERKLTKVDNNKWSAALEHETKGPSLKNPLTTQINGGFKVAPREISVVVLDYYIKPPKAVFAYTKVPGNPQTGAGDQIIYDSVKSKPLMWPATMINEFVISLGERYSLFTRDQFMAQATAQKKATG